MMWLRKFTFQKAIAAGYFQSGSRSAMMAVRRGDCIRKLEHEQSRYFCADDTRFALAAKI